MYNKSSEGKPLFIQYGSIKIDFTIYRSGRKSVGISINRANEVKVIAPKWVNESQIREVVFNKASWIIKKLSVFEDPEVKNKEIYFTDGSIFKYQGQEYLLELNRSSEKSIDEVYLKDNKVLLTLPEGLAKELQNALILEKMTVFYKKRAEQLIKERIDFYKERMKVSPKKIVIKQQKSRWGSCSSRGNININWKIIMAPLIVIDYLVVHELAHLKFMNHSKTFWGFVEESLPDFNYRRKWLKENQGKLEF